MKRYWAQAPRNKSGQLHSFLQAAYNKPKPPGDDTLHRSLASRGVRHVTDLRRTELMAIRRAATLIAFPTVPGERHLPGTIQDVKNMRDFLQLPFGGAWTESEIVILTDPSRKDLDARTKAVAGVDYAVTLYTGHGCHDTRTSDDTVCLQVGTMTIAEMAPRVTRQTMIVDACREFYDFVEKRALALAAEMKMARTGPSETYIAACRRGYDELVMDAPEGRSTIYSCALNQTAGETVNGAFFLSALIGINEEWAKGVWSTNGNPDAPKLFRDLPRAFEVAHDDVVKNHFPQKPELENGRRQKSYPFAIG